MNQAGHRRLLDSHRQNPARRTNDLMFTPPTVLLSLGNLTCTSIHWKNLAYCPVHKSRFRAGHWFLPREKPPQEFTPLMGIPGEAESGGSGDCEISVTRKPQGCPGRGLAGYIGKTSRHAYCTPNCPCDFGFLAAGPLACRGGRAQRGREETG